MRVPDGLALLSVLAVAACGRSSSPASYRTEAQKESYAVGVNIGERMRASSSWIDVRALERGIEEALAGRPVAFSRDSLQALVDAFTKKLGRDQFEARVAEGGKNLKAGRAYMAKNAQKAGVKTTKSGLQYEVLKEGDGPRPDSADYVTVNYRGMLVDGTVFDSGQAATMAIGRSIRGFSEGLQLMRVGGKDRFVIPPNLAYGPGGFRDRIGPDETLIFEVDLLKIDTIGAKKDATAAGVSPRKK